MRGALFLLILGPKSYLVQAHKPHISPRHGLGPVFCHVMGFLQPTLGPLGYLVVKGRSKCDQVWTLGVEECLWGWGSPRLNGGIPGTEGAQNGVSSERKERKKNNKKREGEGKKKERKRRDEKERKRKRDSQYLGGRGLSHFEEDFQHI